MTNVTFLGLVALTGILVVVTFCEDSFHDSGRSVSIQEATNLVEFPLLDSVTNVWFYEKVGGLQCLDRFMRFELANRDITNQLNLITSNNNYTLERSLPYTRMKIDQSKIIRPFDKGDRLSWWSPEKITNGFCVMENRAYSLQIWVDEDSGIFFIHQGD